MSLESTPIVCYIFLSDFHFQTIYLRNFNFAAIKYVPAIAQSSRMEVNSIASALAHAFEYSIVMSLIMI